MRFFTDNYFTEQQKAELLGSAYEAYAKEQQREQRLALECERREREAAIEMTQQSRRPPMLGGNVKRIGLALLACIVVFATIAEGAGRLIINI